MRASRENERERGRESDGKRSSERERERERERQGEKEGETQTERERERPGEGARIARILPKIDYIAAQNTHGRENKFEHAHTPIHTHLRKRVEGGGGGGEYHRQLYYRYVV